MRCLPIILLFVLFCKQSFAQIDFIENKGQWNSIIRYKGELQYGSFYLENQGFSVVLHDTADYRQLGSLIHGNVKELNKSITLKSCMYRMKLVSSNSVAGIQSFKQQSGYNNYFLGNDSSKWATACRMFQQVVYKNIYTNVDVQYYSSGDNLKYDFILHPGANSNAIVMEYDGVNQLAIRNKELIIQTSVGEVRELKPYAYQTDESGNRNEIKCQYVLSGKKVYFQLGAYDIKRTLIIDPSIRFSSFTGSNADNWGYTATPGPDGSFFAGGVVFSGGYPVSPGAFQTTYNGGEDEISFFPPPNQNQYLELPGHDMAIFKFSPNGFNRLYATYLGGSRNEQPHSMICDAQGNLIITGRTSSSNFPTTRSIGPLGGYDIFITKLNANGTGLVGSVRIGGSSNDGVNIRSKYAAPNGPDRLRRYYGDDARSEVILDESSNIILASCTQSPDFPVVGIPLNTNGSFGGGIQDGLVLKFNANLSVYAYGSFFGGSGDDACFVCDISSTTNDLFIGGGTTSNNLPGNNINVISPNYQGGVADGFITSIKNDFTSINKTTFLGTGNIDVVYGVKCDKKGFPYVVGTTTGSWPVLPLSSPPYNIAGSSQFVAKLKPDLSQYVYSTVFGTGSSLPNISPVAFSVDRCENVYISGWGGGINQENYGTGNTNGLPEVNPLPGIPAADGQDFYFIVFEKDATRILFSTHFGQFGGESDHVDGGTSRFSTNGIIYQAMCANCGGGATFPTTTGVWSRVNRSANCNQAAVKIEMDFTGVAASIQPSINAIKNDTSACVPFIVRFTDTLQKGRTMYWDFGNGLKDTTRAPIFSTQTSYANVQTYTVRVITEDSSTCNIRDTAYIQIKAGNDSVQMAFNAVKRLPCTGLDFDFINQSFSILGTSFQANSFTWDFGDGSPTITSGGNVSHTFADTGTYTITLTLNDTRFCNAPVKKSIQLRVRPILKAEFNTSSYGCVPYTAGFVNLSGTTDIRWDLSNGVSSTADPFSYTFNTPGTYTVTLTATDPNTCNVTDVSPPFSIIVSDKPQASATWLPNPPVVNTPVQFTNTSLGAINYIWQFGDGDSSNQINPTHQYIGTGTFDAQLIAINQYGCKDTFPLQVRALIEPVLDVPNAFTPGQTVNNTIYVKGFGIQKMDWRIYNRWGQQIFRSTSIKNGWDGTLNGRLQALDVYTYTLDVNYSDGTFLRKTGDITLLR